MTKDNQPAGHTAGADAACERLALAVIGLGPIQARDIAELMSSRKRALDRLALADQHRERIAETVKETGGYWSPCSGCYDTEDGHPTASYPYSALLGCDVGSGCSECGGLGATWDDLSYVGDMVSEAEAEEELRAALRRAQPEQSAQQGEG